MRACLYTRVVGGAGYAVVRNRVTSKNEGARNAGSRVASATGPTDLAASRQRGMPKSISRKSAGKGRPARGVRSLLRDHPGGQTIFTRRLRRAGKPGVARNAALCALREPRPLRSSRGRLPGVRENRGLDLRALGVRVAPVRGHRTCSRFKTPLEAPLDGEGNTDYIPIGRIVKRVHSCVRHGGRA